MKKILFTTIVVFLVGACGSSTEIVPTKTEPSATASAASQTPTTIPPTETPAPTTTLALPIGYLTPVPSSNEIIHANTIQGLTEIARYYGDINYAAKLTADNAFLFVLDPGGLTKYEYASMKLIMNVALANSASNLQISSDGNWAIIDNKILLDLRNGREPKQYVLPDLLDLYAETYALSPDGSLIAAQQFSCPNLCQHDLRIVSTKDLSVLHTDKASTLQSVFAFSPDGAYYAVVDTVQQQNPDGSTGGVGAVASIWKTSDFTKVSSIPIRFPFRISSIAFSPDNSMLAVSQLEFIDIFDFQGGDPKISIGNLCLAYDRKVMFELSTPPILFEKSSCSSMVWKISGDIAAPIDGNGPDLSKVMFDKDGKYKSIPFPYPVVPEFRPYRQEYYFRFLDSETISFRSFAAQTLDRYTCNLSLKKSVFDCQAYTPKEENGQILGKGRILANDDKFYNYVVGKSTIDFYSEENPNQIYHSIPFHRYGFEVEALDPENNVIFYNMYLSTTANRVVIQDLSNDRLLQKWEGKTFIQSVVFSGDGRYAAFCRILGYNNRPNKDKLMIFDMVDKKVVYNQTFTCGGVSLAFNHDGSKLAVEHYYLKKPTDRRYSTELLVFNTQPPYDKKTVEVETSSSAVAFSPDDSLLAVACHESDICFFDAATNTQIFQLQANPQISTIAFSPDGKLMAASSDWALLSVWAIHPLEVP
jgi:WD40 repeat protein